VISYEEGEKKGILPIFEDVLVAPSQHALALVADGEALADAALLLDVHALPLAVLEPAAGPAAVEGARRRRACAKEGGGGFSSAIRFTLDFHFGEGKIAQKAIVLVLPQPGPALAITC